MRGSVVKRAEVARYWGAIAETWTRHAHAGYDIYRVGLNTPAFLETLPPVRGLSGLDIGCGEGPTRASFHGLERGCMGSMSRRPSSGMRVMP